MLQGLKSWASAFSIDLGSKSIGLSWAFSKHFKSFQKSSVGKNGSWNFERHGPWPPQYPRCPWQCQCRLVSRLEHRWRRLPSWRRSHPKTSESLPQNWRAMLGVMLQNNINKQTPWRVHEWKTCISYNIYNIYHIYIYIISPKKHVCITLILCRVAMSCLCFGSVLEKTAPSTSRLSLVVGNHYFPPDYATQRQKHSMKAIQ